MMVPQQHTRIQLRHQKAKFHFCGLLSFLPPPPAFPFLKVDLVNLSSAQLGHTSCTEIHVTPRHSLKY